MSQLVSIVMPLHNAEQYVGQAIQSCIAQTHGNFELLVVDDGSVDRSAQVVQEYVDLRVRLITLPRNQGPGPARNVGLDASKGDWITVIDADDLYHVQRLSALISLAAEHGTDRVYVDGQTRWELQQEPPVSLWGHQIEDELLTSRIFSGCEWVAEQRGGQPFFHRRLLEQTGARYPALRASEDTVFLLRLVLRAQTSIIEHSAKTYIYRRTPGSLVVRTPARLRESERAYGLLLRESYRSPEFAQSVECHLARLRRERQVGEFKEALLKRHYFAAVYLAVSCPGTCWEVLKRIWPWVGARLRILLRRRRQRESGDKRGSSLS